MINEVFGTPIEQRYGNLSDCIAFTLYPCDFFFYPSIPSCQISWVCPVAVKFSDSTRDRILGYRVAHDGDRSVGWFNMSSFVEADEWLFFSLTLIISILFHFRLADAYLT